MKPKIYVHGSYIGNTGYNQHTRDFFREISKYVDLKVRNFTIGNTWKGYNLTPHDEEPYINSTDKKILFEQILWEQDRTRNNYPIYPSEGKNFNHDLNIVLCETNHYLFYDEYLGPKIAYNVWETTLQPQQFFEKLLEFDEMWVPSKWQKNCMIQQGYPENKIKVVPEGVDTSMFRPDENVKHPLTSDGRFKFFLAGRWDYRKSIKEIIETFLKTFEKEEPVDLIISVDNPFSNDGLKTTEERLKHYGLEDERIKVLHFPERSDYINLLKSCNCFVSCARSEGWNLPLIEAMSCGTPSIYSNCSGQLEFAEGRGISVEIIGEKSAKNSSYNHFNESVGNYYEPNFEDLSNKMRLVVENYVEEKKRALKESFEIHKNFSWESVGKVGYETIKKFYEKLPSINSNKKTTKNKIEISYLDGPKVEILGTENKKYFVEFINKENQEVLHSQLIENNMWVCCTKKYYIPWQIKINGEVVDELNLKGKTILISFESKSLGDTIAWVPYSINFSKKHNCKVIVSTFHNNLFKNLKAYSEIDFISPGESVNCTAVYRIGWFRKNDRWEDADRNPNQVNLIPLQKTATDILGLEFEEKNYGVYFQPKQKPFETDYVVFAPQSTAGCKEWRYDYWAELSKMFIDAGYQVITLTKNPYFLDNTTNLFDESMDEVINYLQHASFFIGLGSGLSWLNWAIGKHTFMINGFTEDLHEFSSNITKIYNKFTCIKCWNDEVFVFDTKDWDWCPVYKGTKKQHVCQRSITPEQVFNTIFS